MTYLGKEYHRKWYSKNKHRIIHDYHKNKDNPEWRFNRLVKARNRRVELKNEIFRLLGEVCNECGFSDKRALQIDHINSDGYIERKRGGSHDQYLRILRSIVKKENRYQILCCNCNWIKRVEKKEANHPIWQGAYFPEQFKIDKNVNKICAATKQEPSLFSL